MKDKSQNNNEPPVHAPILSLACDRRVGGSPGSWALYQTRNKWIYCAIAHPEGDEYIIPIAASIIRDFNILAEREDPSSLIDQIENLSGRPNHSAADETALSPDTPPVPPEDYAEDILYLTPGRDFIWGTGTDAIGFTSANGIPYFTHENFCVCCSTLPFCRAVQYFTTDTPATIVIGCSAEENPCFIATQGKTTITFHICEEELLPDFSQNENVLHVARCPSSVVTTARRFRMRSKTPHIDSLSRSGSQRVAPFYINTNKRK